MSASIGKEKMKTLVLVCGSFFLLYPAFFIGNQQQEVTSRPVTSLRTKYHGFGSRTRGGSEGIVVRVTSLEDSGPGSLREALSQGDRHIIFDVGGEIDLKNRYLPVKGSFITIDGFTAPPPGITIKNGGVQISGKHGAHDVVVRGIRVRNAVRDGIQIAHGAFNLVIDHVSIHGSGDGNLDITEGAHDVTVSWSILAEPAGGNKNMLIMYNNPRRITLHHNLFTKATSRNPQVQTDGEGTPATETTVDMRNNVIWDWGGGYGTRIRNGPRVNVVNNLYASNRGDAKDALIASAARVYAKGNISADRLDLDVRGNMNAPFPAPSVDTQDACRAAHQVLAEAGARPLDSVDQRYVSVVSLPLCPPVHSALP